MGHPFSSAFPNSGTGYFDAANMEGRLRALADREPFVFPDGDVPAEFRRSSVLVCFWREETDLRVILTKRAASLSGHPGQMCFPGGKCEAGESVVDAALRETEEEVGIPRESVEVLGRLDDAWSGAGHLLVPIVGWLNAPPRFVPNPDEVAEMHTPGVAGLMVPSAYSEEEVELGDRRFVNSILEWETGKLFGLSTDILIESLVWALGGSASYGPARLESLRVYSKLKADKKR